MTKLSAFHPADWSESIDDVQNAAGYPIFKEAALCWCSPRPWPKGQKPPVTKDDIASVYAIVRNHGKSQTRDIIEYVGLTRKPEIRFNNHKTAERIVQQHGSVGISFAPINFIKGKNRIENIGRALEDIEHILIWALGPRHNEKKNYTLPMMGANRGNAWHIINTAFRFAGQMPMEIVFPWMLVRRGRNRAKKVAD